MISETVLNPRYAYVQDTEPSDKTEGKKWYNTTTKDWYTADGSSYVMDSVDLSGINKQQLEQDLNILINSASASALNDYEDMFLDIFSDSDGYDGTIDTANTDAVFDTDKYKNGADGEGVFQTNASQATSTSINPSFTKVKTLTVNSLVTKGMNEIRINQTGYQVTCKYKFIYADATPDAEVSNGHNTDSYAWKTYTNPNPAVEVATIEVWLAKQNGAATAYEQSDTLYKTFTITDSIVQTNAQSIDADPQGHQVFCHSSVAGTGSVTYDISFDGGTTWVTDQAVNTKNTSVHAGSSMKVKLNLNGVGAGNTAEASDYAVMLDY